MKPPALPSRIVSGGQTGVDQAALTVAVSLSIAHGGWCPLGRRCETGVIPSRFDLDEMSTSSYSARTRQNVIDSDGTLILYRAQLTGGTLLTSEIAQQLARPLLLLDLEETLDLEQARQWLQTSQVTTLNVAGPRESSCPGIHQQACQVLTDLFHPAHG